MFDCSLLMQGGGGGGGGEPGKLLLEDWKMIESDRWKRESDIDRITDPVEKQLMQRLKLCYIEGKKKKRVEYWH